MIFPQRLARTLVIVAFLLRGTFYCAEQPVWEGFDEWAHFGYIQHLAQYGCPPSRSEPVSDELRRAVELAPISASAADYSRESLTHDAFWRLSAGDRIARERELRQLRSSYKSDAPGHQVLREYEAQQPPLYYLLLAPVYLSLKNISLPAQVFALRFASLLIAAVGILLCCELALQVSPSRRAAIPIMLLLSSWPGFLVNASRIGNDVLALTLGSAYILCLFQVLRSDSGLRDWMRAGVILGAALLAKSYMLTLVPLLPLIVVTEAARRPSRLTSAYKGFAAALAFVCLIAGWWYVGNYTATGTLSGEQIDAAAAHLGFLQKFTALRSIKWLGVLDAASSTHIWAGGWSFLTVRSWMYRIFEYLVIAAGLGLIPVHIRMLRKISQRGLGAHDAYFLLAVCSYLFFCSALAYYALVVYLTRGSSTVLGWYLDAIGGVEAVLLASGFAGLVGTRRAAGCIGAVAALACALDLYTVHFISLPYYTGITGYLTSGFVASFHPVEALRRVGLVGVFARLAVNKPVTPSVLTVLWAGYLCATLGLLAYSAGIIKEAFFPERQARTKGSRSESASVSPK